VIYDVGRVLKRLQEHIDSRRTAKAGNFQRAFGYVMGSRLLHNQYPSTVPVSVKALIPWIWLESFQ
jgi:hypothetical protein